MINDLLLASLGLPGSDLPGKAPGPQEEEEGSPGCGGVPTSLRFTPSASACPSPGHSPGSKRKLRRKARQGPKSLVKGAQRRGGGPKPPLTPARPVLMFREPQPGPPGEGPCPPTLPSPCPPRRPSWVGPLAPLLWVGGPGLYSRDQPGRGRAFWEIGGWSSGRFVASFLNFGVAGRSEEATLGARLGQPLGGESRVRTFQREVWREGSQEQCPEVCLAGPLPRRPSGTSHGCRAQTRTVALLQVALHASLLPPTPHQPWG